jgi:hypothetical protein
MGNEIIIDIEEEYLRNFARHCHTFYLSSLSPTSSAQSSSLLSSLSSSLSSLDEEKTKHNSCHDLAQVKNDGKIVLEAYDRICIISSNVNVDRTNNQNQKSITNLQNEHDLCAINHEVLLKECGLLEIDQFKTPDAVNLLQKYSEVRDAMRRQAHKSAMVHRQNSFFELLSRAEQDCLEYPVETCAMATTKTTTTATVNNIKATISTIEKFVRKYQSKIGSHSLIAGLHKFVNLQLNPNPGSNLRSSDPRYVVRWTIRSSVLTEACMPAGADGDELAYARDALKALFSFLILSKKEDIERGIDDAVVAATEPVVSFEIQKFLSNASLRRILNVLPNPNGLDARATGSFFVLADTVDIERFVSRKNVDGHLDEPWPFFQDFRVEFCTLL